jgi:hypothetical protein
MNLSDLKQSKFLKKEDVEPAVLVTIRGMTQENVAKEGADPEMRTALHFDELDKPMILNSTNGQIIAKITGKETDIEMSWVGSKVVLYHDPNVSFGGKLVGGIRVRAPRTPSAKVQTPAQQVQAAAEENPLPF